ncbi:MAG: hypothetical protein AAGD01_15770 [Acidobacteriota bacterium]
MKLSDTREAHYRQLVEKWLFEDLSEAELTELPEEVRKRVQTHFQSLIDEALEDVGAGRVVDGPRSLARMRDELRSMS